MSNPTDPRPDGLPPLPPPPPHTLTDDHIPLALTDLDEVAEILPAAEVIEDVAAFDLPDIPEAQDGERTLGVEYLSEAEQTGLPPIPPVSPAESWVTEGAEPEFIPTAPPASSSALFDDPPPVAGAADSGEIVDLAGPSPSASSLFGESVPDAGPASGFIPAAAAAGDSAVDVDPAVEPVAPASGWFSRDDVPVVPAADGIEAELAGPRHAGTHGDGSDVFASPPPSRPRGDGSDVIAATSWADPASPASPVGRPADHTSDVALTFDQPPGGSTVQEPADDLPVADEADDGAGSLFGDSATLAHTSPLPDADAPDFGASPYGAADASSILADLSEPAAPLTDGSAVRIEAPGIDPTMSDDELPAEFVSGDSRARLWSDDRTEVDYGADGSSSDLFPEPRSGHGPRFELTPELGGATDLFAGVEDGEEPSLSSAPSSIFTTPVAPLSGGSDALTGEGDAVEFSDHPDPAASGVDFDDMGGGPTYPERTLHEAIPEDDAMLLSDSDRNPRPSPSSGDVLSAGSGEGAGLEWMTPAPPSGPRKSKKEMNLDRTTDPGFLAEPAAPVRPVRPGTTQPATSGSVELDWVAGSSTSELVLAEPAPARPSRRPARGGDAPTDATRTVPAAGGGVNRGAGVGLLLGLLLGGGGASGVYFSGALDGPKPTGPVAVVPRPGDTNAAPTPGTVAPPTTPDAQAALAAGDPVRALKALEAAGATTPDAKAARGQARLFARLRDPAAVTADDAALKDARADLEAAMTDADEKTAVRAAVHLGLTHEVAGDRAKAKEVYATAATKFPKAADVFQAALDRLDATAPPAPPGAATSLRLAPADAERLAVATAFLFLQDDPAPAAEPAEAGGPFWRAINQGARRDYARAIESVKQAKEAHTKRAAALAGRGLNPLSDPREQIFPRACDELVAYWELSRTIYLHPTVGPLARAETVGKALDTFAGYRTERDTAVANATLAKAQLDAAQKGLLAEQEALKTAKAELTTEKAAAVKLGDDLKKAGVDLTKAKADAVALTKDVDAAKKLADDNAAKAKLIEGELATVDKGRKDAEAVVAGVASELKAAKILPEKYAPADVIAAAKSAASRATGPDLTSLIPPGTTAAVGGAATTATLLDLAARAGKLDAAAKQSAADLKAAITKHAADFAKAKADADAAYKTAVDSASKVLDKAKTDAATELTRTKADAEKLLTKTKADALAEVAKTKTDTAGMLTKMKADSDAALTKLKTDHKAETAALDKKLADDAAAAKSALAVAEKQFRAELANAVSPAEALPLWQAVLTDLRRPADADAALAAAERVQKSAVPDSEAAARANTVSGLALALKGDKDGARTKFEVAKRSPAYAATKDWARAADTGLASLTDPAAASRVVVDGTRRANPAEAVRSLTAGVAAFNAGNAAAAERALADAAWHDPTSPLPWYFLGAARWAANPNQARDDFRQGAEREAKGAMPSRAISNAIAAIQGPARAALDAVRP